MIKKARSYGIAWQCHCDSVPALVLALPGPGGGARNSLQERAWTSEGQKLAGRASLPTSRGTAALLIEYPVFQISDSASTNQWVRCGCRMTSRLFALPIRLTSSLPNAVQTFYSRAKY